LLIQTALKGMAAVIQVGQAVLDAPTLIAKLKEYQLMPKLVQEIVVDMAIAHVDCSRARSK
jgi:hypothetical protein